MAKAKRRVIPKKRGKSERRTAPARGSKARGAVKKKTRRAPRFAPSERVTHTVTQERDKTTGEARAAKTTSCCGQPIDKVYAIAFGKESFKPGTEVVWCPKAQVPA